MVHFTLTWPPNINHAHTHPNNGDPTLYPLGILQYA